MIASRSVCISPKPSTWLLTAVLIVCLSTPQLTFAQRSDAPRQNRAPTNQDASKQSAQKQNANDPNRPQRNVPLNQQVSSFLLIHALQGWCPPLPVLRRLGFGTASEIDYERYALKALRGDFSNLHQSHTPASTALRAAES